MIDSELTLEETNLRLGEAFREMKRIHLLLCRTQKNTGSRREAAKLCGVYSNPTKKQDVQDLLPQFCACFDRVRALVGRLLIFAGAENPCCWPGPLDKPTKCGGMCLVDKKEADA